MAFPVPDRVSLALPAVGQVTVLPWSVLARAASSRSAASAFFMTASVFLFTFAANGETLSECGAASLGLPSGSASAAVAAWVSRPGSNAKAMVAATRRAVDLLRAGLAAVELSGFISRPFQLVRQHVPYVCAWAGLREHVQRAG